MTKTRTKFRLLSDRMAGPDIFISYKCSEAKRYAQAIYDYLTDTGYSCFLDAEQLDSGSALIECKRQASRCRMFLLIGTPGILNSEWVKEEITAYNVSHTRFPKSLWRRILLVDVEGAMVQFAGLKSAETNVPSAFNCLYGIVSEPESATGLKNGHPTSSVLDRITRSYKFMRAAVSTTMVLVLLTLAVISSWAGLSLNIAALGRKKTGLESENKNLSIETVQLSAKNERLTADVITKKQQFDDATKRLEIAKSESVRFHTAAVAFRKDAGIQKIAAARYRREAETQSKIAEALRLSNISTDFAASSPITAALFAVNAQAVLPAKMEHPTVTSALYNSLCNVGGKSLPGPLQSYDYVVLDGNTNTCIASGDDRLLPVWHLGGRSNSPLMFLRRPSPIGEARLAFATDDGTAVLSDRTGTYVYDIGNKHHQTVIDPTLRYLYKGIGSTCVTTNPTIAWTLERNHVTVQHVDQHGKAVAATRLNLPSLSISGGLRLNSELKLVYLVMNEALFSKLIVMDGATDDTQPLPQITVGRGTVTDCIMSVDRQWVCVLQRPDGINATAPQAVLIHNIGARDEMYKYDAEQAVFSNDSKFLCLVGAANKTVVCVDLKHGQNGRPINHTILNTDDDITALACGPKSRFIVAGHSSGAISVVPLSEAGELYAGNQSFPICMRYTGHSGPVAHIAFASKGLSFVTVASNDAPRIWDLQSLKSVVPQVTYTNVTGQGGNGWDSMQLVDVSDTLQDIMAFDICSISMVGTNSGAESFGRARRLFDIPIDNGTPNIDKAKVVTTISPYARVATSMDHSRVLSFEINSGKKKQVGLLSIFEKAADASFVLKGQLTIPNCDGCNDLKISPDRKFALLSCSEPVTVGHLTTGLNANYLIDIQGLTKTKITQEPGSGSQSVGFVGPLLAVSGKSSTCLFSVTRSTNLKLLRSWPSGSGWITLSDHWDALSRRLFVETSDLHRACVEVYRVTANLDIILETKIKIPERYHVTSLKYPYAVLSPALGDHNFLVNAVTGSVQDIGYSPGAHFTKSGLLIFHTVGNAGVRLYTPRPSQLQLVCDVPGVDDRLAVSDNGKLLASITPTNGIKIWRIGTDVKGKVLLEIRRMGTDVQRLIFGTMGNSIFVTSNGRIEHYPLSLSTFDRDPKEIIGRNMRQWEWEYAFSGSDYRTTMSNFPRESDVMMNDLSRVRELSSTDRKQASLALDRLVRSCIQFESMALWTHVILYGTLMNFDDNVRPLMEAFNRTYPGEPILMLLQGVMLAGKGRYSDSNRQLSAFLKDRNSNTDLMARGIGLHVQQAVVKGTRADVCEAFQVVVSAMNISATRYSGPPSSITVHRRSGNID